MISNRGTFTSFQDIIEQQILINDPKMIPHLSKILQYISSTNEKNLNLSEVSNILKKTNPIISNRELHNLMPFTIPKSQFTMPKQCQSQIKNFNIESEKLQWAGICFNTQERMKIHNSLTKLAIQNDAKQIRFFGKILGIYYDYYVIQGVIQPPKVHEADLSGQQQKSGEGVNYYTFWVTNNLQQNWTKLPRISPSHIRCARKIKRMFTGILNAKVISFPSFPGQEKHYLKAQLCRMAHSLELSAKGIYKVHDENPKIIQFEEQVKIPQFAQMSTLEGWVHKNLNLLNLGRCTHYIDKNLPQQQIQAISAQLSEKDPEIQRLRSITQDKTSQAVNNLYGLQNLWILRTLGDSQVFTKDQNSLVYGVVSLRNINWPGWLTIGYKGGFSNIYIGRGLKASQPSLDNYQNPNLMQQALQNEQFSEPNPKQQPKVVEQKNEQQQPPDEQ